MSIRGACPWMARAMAAVILVVATPSCSRCNAEEAPAGTAPGEKDLPTLTLKDDTPDALLTWIDEKGDFHVVQHPADVPDDARAAVRVVTPQGGSGSILYVADLRKKRPDGTYPVKTMARSQWEQIAEKRRSAHMEALAPKPPSSRAGDAGNEARAAQPSTSITAIVYGASWCSACRGAERYLRRKGVHVVFKDVDKDAQARPEMKAKLAKAGLRDTGSIPVIDIQGHLLKGYDPRAIDRILKQLSAGDYL